MKKTRNRLMALVLAGLMALLVACGAKGSNLVGTWVQDGSTREITFYKDGTYTMSGEYGTGEWSVLDSGDLKLVDFYGSTNTVAYTVKGDTLRFADSNDDTYYVTYTKK